MIRIWLVLVAVSCFSSCTVHRRASCSWASVKWNATGLLRVGGTEVQLGQLQKASLRFTGTLYRTGTNQTLVGRWWGDGLSVQGEMPVEDAFSMRIADNTRIATNGMALAGTPARVLDSREGRALVQPLLGPDFTSTTPAAIGARCESLAFVDMVPVDDAALMAELKLGAAEPVLVKALGDIALSAEPAGTTVGVLHAKSTVPASRVEQRGDESRIAVVDRTVVWVGWVPSEVLEARALPGPRPDAEPDPAPTARTSTVSCDAEIPLFVMLNDVAQRIGSLEANTPFVKGELHGGFVNVDIEKPWLWRGTKGRALLMRVDDSTCRK